MSLTLLFHHLLLNMFRMLKQVTSSWSIKMMHGPINLRTYQFLRLLVSAQNTIYNKSSNFKCNVPSSELFSIDTFLCYTFPSTHNRLKCMSSFLLLYSYKLLIFHFHFRFFEFEIFISSPPCHRILVGMMYSKLEILPAECQSKFNCTVIF